MNRARHALPLAALGLLLPALAACSTGSTDDTTTATAETVAETDAFPVTIEHAFGETTIEQEPTRVAGVGWADADFALSLGVVPVGATAITWGGNDNESTDFFDEALAEVGGDEPVRYSDADGIPVAEIAKTNPDLILATNSGITKQEYRKLSKIAPVVAYPEAPWVTPWQTSLETVGEALGRTSLAEEVAAETQQEIDAAKAEFPQLEGTSFIFSYLTTTDLSTIGIYAPADPRVSFLHDLGMVDAPAVAGAIKPGQFYGSVSAERAGTLDSDVMLTWAENKGDLETFADDKLIGRIPALASGHAYAEENKHVSLAVTNPTPLSIPFVIEHFVPEVANAVDGS